jgi:CheY-like chemotaxis protein
MNINKTILIIDDDVDFHTLIGTILRNSGYKVKSLFEGTVNAATRIARKCDIVLLDIEMPGTNGVDLGRQLKSDPATEYIPVILISGHLEGKQLFQESKANAFLEKPFSVPGLLAKIKELLHG